MSTQWEIVALGNVLTLQRGHDLPSQQRQAGTVPIVSSSGITDFHNEAKAQPPGVVTGRYGTIGEVFYIDEPYWPLNTALYVKDFKGNNPKFIAYLLEGLNLKEMNAAGAVPGINRNHLHKLKVLFPQDCLMQDRVVALVSAYDDLIENNLERIKLLEEMAQITYEEWFVRMKFPGHEDVEIDSETGLPDGWAHSKIGDRYRTSSGGTPSTKNPEFYESGTIKWVRTQELKGGLILDALESITQEGLDKSSAKLFPAKTVLLAMYGNTIGETGFLTIPAATNQACCAFLATENHAYYLHQYFLRHKQKILNYRMGAAQENISQSIIKNITILIPNEDIMNKFGAKASKVYSTIECLMKQVSLLKEARDILLPRLMTGMIDIDKVELPEALLERINKQ